MILDKDFFIIVRIWQSVRSKLLFQLFFVVWIGLLILHRRRFQRLYPLSWFPWSCLIDNPFGNQTLDVDTTHEENVQHRSVPLICLMKNITSNVTFRADDALGLGLIRVYSRP